MPVGKLSSAFKITISAAGIATEERGPTNLVDYVGEYAAMKMLIGLQLFARDIEAINRRWPCHHFPVAVNIEMSVGGQKSTRVGMDAHPCPPPLRGTIPVSEFRESVLVSSTPSIRPPALHTSNMHSIRNY